MFCNNTKSLGNKTIKLCQWVSLTYLGKPTASTHTTTAWEPSIHAFCAVCKIKYIYCRTQKITCLINSYLLLGSKQNWKKIVPKKIVIFNIKFKGVMKSAACSRSTRPNIKSAVLNFEIIIIFSKFWRFEVLLALKL